MATYRRVDTWNQSKVHTLLVIHEEFDRKTRAWREVSREWVAPGGLIRCTIAAGRRRATVQEQPT